MTTDVIGDTRPMAAVLVVILNFNGLADTLACLDSLRHQTSQASILVIDNGSRNDEIGAISAHFPEAETIALKENMGWAGGNNVGLRLALDRDIDQVCLLNNDTVLEPTAIAELVDAAARLREPCLLHPAISYFDEPLKWQLNPEPTDPSAPNPDLVRMDFAYGACLLVPTSVLRRVGLLDERFFLQLEETDYFLRARKLGIPSVCARKARILHKESASFGGRITENKTYYQVRNKLLLTEKHALSPRGFVATVRELVWILRRQAETEEKGGQAGLEKEAGWFRFFSWLLSAHPLARAARQGTGDYFRRRFGRRPTSRRMS